MKAVYARYGSIEQEEINDLDEAKDFLNFLENDGQGYAICIFNEETGIAWITKNMEIAGMSTEGVYSQKINTLKKIGINPIKIEFYK